MPNPTTTGLVKAQIIEAEESSSGLDRKSGGKVIRCMFNPADYTISQSNTYTFEYQNESDVPKMEFSGPGERVLKLNTLYFDSYEQKTDISRETQKLFDLMRPTEESQDTSDTKKRPSPVLFTWGGFEFGAVVTSVSTKFTLFLQDGTPVRAEVTIELKQHLKSDMYQWQAQNPTSGGGPIERIWKVQAGDRLDLIAAQVYHDSTKWRLIAERNRISNPLSIKSGQNLRIPPKSADIN